MREIFLTQGQIALVDDDDYEFISKYKWGAYKHRKGNYYAARQSSRVNGKRRHIAMSRQILGLGQGDKRQVDHINHFTLDNRRDNLRTCTNQQNQQNKISHRESSSMFKGICWDKRGEKWLARIVIKGRQIYLGCWEMEEVAALAYDIAATREFGEFANCNFN